MASLNIKDPEVHALAAELAHRTGKTMTEVIRQSLRKSLAGERSQSSDQARTLRRVMAIADRISCLPVLDSRTPDEILGYDENGLPVR